MDTTVKNFNPTTLEERFLLWIHGTLVIVENKIIVMVPLGKAALTAEGQCYMKLSMDAYILFNEVMEFLHLEIKALARLHKCAQSWVSRVGAVAVDNFRMLTIEAMVDRLNFLFQHFTLA